jgi:iron(III) transport system permease protein
MATAESSIGRRAGPVFRRGQRRRLRLEAMLPLALTVLVAALVVYPMGMVVFGTFWSAAPGQPGTLTLENWATVLSDSATFEVLLTSLAIAVPRTLLALVLATAFAWCIARTNPRASLLEGLLSSCSFCPSCPGSSPGCCWARSVGLLNQWLGARFRGEGLINVYPTAA